MIESQTLDELTEKLEKLAKEGGPAFPSVMSEETKEGVKVEATFYGATLRDYFAAKAMHAIIVNPDGHAHDWMMTAWKAYSMADAMLEARK